MDVVAWRMSWLLFLCDHFTIFGGAEGWLWTTAALLLLRAPTSNLKGPFRNPKTLSPAWLTSIPPSRTALQQRSCRDKRSRGRSSSSQTIRTPRWCFFPPKRLRHLCPLPRRSPLTSALVTSRRSPQTLTSPSNELFCSETQSFNATMTA